MIVQELRQLSINLNLPVLTATQNARSSENLKSEMNNSFIGDSYKKVRYADFIYMCRKCDFKTFLDNDVAFDVLKGKSSNFQPTPQELIAYESLCKVLIPFEIKITKAKDGVKDASRYCLFCTENLRIYDTVDQYLQDKKELIANSKELENQIMQLDTFSAMPVIEFPAFMSPEF